MIVMLVAPLWVLVYGLAYIWGAPDAVLSSIMLIGVVTSLLSMILGDM